MLGRCHFVLGFVVSHKSRLEDQCGTCLLLHVVYLGNRVNFWAELVSHHCACCASCMTMKEGVVGKSNNDICCVRTYPCIWN